MRMLTGRRRRSAGVFTAILSLCLVAVVARGAAQTPSALDDGVLAKAAQTFLNQWLVSRNPAGAIATHFSPLLTDERFLPQAEAGPGADPVRLTPQWMNVAHPLTAQVFQAQMTGYLGAVAQGLRRPESSLDLVLPFSMNLARDSDEELGEILMARGARALPSYPGFQALAYRVQSWKDIQWLATGTVGYRTSLNALMVQQALNVQAVVTRIGSAAPNTEPKILVTLWAERAAAPREWKLLGVEVAPGN